MNFKSLKGELSCNRSSGLWNSLADIIIKGKLSNNLLRNKIWDRLWINLSDRLRNKLKGGII